MGAPRKGSATDVLEYLESQYDDGELLCWTDAARDFGYANTSPLRRHVQNVAVVDSEAKTVTLPSGKVLRLQVPGGNGGRRGKRRNPAARTVRPEAMTAARAAKSAEQARAVAAHLDDLAARRVVLDLEALGKVLGICRRAAGDAVRRVPGVTVTRERVLLPDGREIARMPSGRLPSGPRQRDKLTAARKATREARQARVAAEVTAVLEQCLDWGIPVALEALQAPTGCATPEGARMAVQRLPGFEVDRTGIGLPDGRRVPRRSIDGKPACKTKAPSKSRKSQTTNKTRPRAAAVAAGAPSCPPPKPAHPSASAPRVSSPQPTAGAGATPPTSRALAGSSSVVALEPRPARMPLPGDVFPPPGGCLWPEGNVWEPGFHFCGAPQAPNKPYCRAHVTRAYTVRVPKETAE